MAKEWQKNGKIYVVNQPDSNDLFPLVDFPFLCIGKMQQKDSTASEFRLCQRKYFALVGTTIL